MLWWSDKELEMKQAEQILLLLREGRRRAPRWLLVVTILLLIPSLTNAQNPTPPPQQEGSSGTTSNPGVYNGSDIYAPKDAPKTEGDSGPTSFSDGFLRNKGHHIGFSFSAFESYTPDALGPSTGDAAPGTGSAAPSSGQTGMTLSTFLPQVYANFRKKAFDFRLNYGYVYNRYGGSLSALSHGSQNGNAAFTYSVLHRKTTFQITDFATSLTNDPTSFLGSVPTAIYQLGTTPQVYVDRRRETRNTAAISLSQALTRKLGVSISAGADAFRFSGSPFTKLFSATFGTDYKINKWMEFNVRYTHYLNYVDPTLRNNNFEHLQVAGFNFKFGKGWQISSSAGIDSTSYGAVNPATNGTQRFNTASGEAAISKTSKHTSMGISYRRGYSTVFPSPDILSGDSASLNVVQSISRHVNIHANSYYFRGSVLAASSINSTMSATAGMDVILQKNLIFSTNYFLVSQQIRDTSLTGTTLHRNTVSVGLQYYFPSVSTR